jgi:hypothetical protein
MSNKTNYSFENPFIGGKSLLFPSSLKWLARRTLLQLKENNNNASVDFGKAEGLLESLLTRQTENPVTQQRPTHALCPGLTARPVWESKDHPLLLLFEKKLAGNVDIFKQEYVQANQQGHYARTINTGKGYLPENSWQNIRLGNFGNYPKNIRALFPQTISLLESFGKRIFSAEFIIMEVDTSLPPHTDATNAYLVCHLGLDVPENCGVQVKDCLIDFHQGDLIFFDQSFVHSAWNKGERSRVNLLLTFFHPDISDQEVELLYNYIQVLQKKALVFSPVILTEYLFLKLFKLFRK